MEYDGESAEYIYECLKVIFQALPKSSLSTVEQMLWIANMENNDGYDLCIDAEVFWNREFTTEEWNH